MHWNPFVVLGMLMAALFTFLLAASPSPPLEAMTTADVEVVEALKPSATHPSIAGGPLVIETTLMTERGRTFGDFEVVQGDAELGCDSGTFQDRIIEPDIFRTFTCVVGERSGSFTIGFLPWMHYSAPGMATRSWQIDRGTDEFADLHGAGDVHDPITGGAETFIGKTAQAEVVDHAAAQTSLAFAWS